MKKPIAIMELVQTYRRQTEEKICVALGFQIYCMIEPDLLLFVLGQVQLGRVHQSAVKDVLQEALKSIFANLLKLKGKTEKEFWGWCYVIVLNKVYDHQRKRITKERHEFPMDEMMELVEASSEGAPLSPQDRLDLEYAMNLLSKSKPECRELLWNHFVIG